MAQALPILIAGGGIGGLAAANALVRRGMEVSVFEQAPALGEVGAGVFIYPNSLRQLERTCASWSAWGSAPPWPRSAPASAAGRGTAAWTARSSGRS